MDKIKYLEKELFKIKNGFKIIEKQAKTDYSNYTDLEIRNLAYKAYKSKIYQVRMYGVFLLGYLSGNTQELDFLRDEVSKDENWRVQEILAKSFNEYCSKFGYENSLTIIDNWLENNNPNIRRAVTEGLRIWTNRPYFKENPKEVILRLSILKEDESEYVRKSVGNAIRDISKKHPILIKEELKTWKLNNKKIIQVYKLANKFIQEEK